LGACAHCAAYMTRVQLYDPRKPLRNKKVAVGRPKKSGVEIESKGSGRGRFSKAENEWIDRKEALDEFRWDEPANSAEYTDAGGCICEFFVYVFFNLRNSSFF